MASKLSVDTKNFIPSILIIAFLLVGFVKNGNTFIFFSYADAVDKVAPQWVYLTIVNILSAIYLFVNRSDFEITIYRVINTSISLFYIIFFVRS